MSRNRKILVTLVCVGLLMAAIHFTVNGIPALSSLNPHGH
ncbi:hypothetical protein FBY22_4132 [Streptomyces sp. SLBN-31]|nr:hypothetical protein FBY22_4132 [Streptomyces sp. SLBN-31]